MLTRKLGHPELVFNEKIGKTMHFETSAASKWSLSKGDQCWICDKFKYTIIFFNREDPTQHWTEITN